MRVIIKNDKPGDDTTLRELPEQDVTLAELMQMVKKDPVASGKGEGWCFSRYDGTRYQSSLEFLTFQSLSKYYFFKVIYAQVVFANI
jgi:hypothetical protein